jgi:hypothetical protein
MSFGGGGGAAPRGALPKPVHVDQKWVLMRHRDVTKMLEYVAATAPNNNIVNDADTPPLAVATTEPPPKATLSGSTATGGGALDGNNNNNIIDGGVGSCIAPPTAVAGAAVVPTIVAVPKTKSEKKKLTVKKPKYCKKLNLPKLVTFIRKSKRLTIDKNGVLAVDRKKLAPLNKLVCQLLWSKAKQSGASPDLTRFLKILPPNAKVARTMDSSVARAVIRHRSAQRGSGGGRAKKSIKER